MLISEIVAALQAEIEKRGDSAVMQRVFAKPTELQPMAELPFVIQVDEHGEFIALVMRLP